jgi:predicted DsbA family dithiol-disulfide isomerase
MGGLISDWKSFHDPMNVISRPVQMGPLWMEARHLSGMKIQDRIWMEDPPASSYPACIAVKCAELQSAAAGEKYLRALREAVMLHGQNIAGQEVLLQVAETLALQVPLIFDVVKFAEDLSVGAGRAAFRKDLQNVRYHNIGRFPSLTLRTQKTGVIIVGYRPYNVLLEALAQVAPDLQPVQPLKDMDDYASYWSSITERELLEASVDLKNDV